MQTLDAVLLNVADWYEVACRKALAGHAAPTAAASRAHKKPGPRAFLAACLRGEKCEHALA